MYLFNGLILNNNVVPWTIELYTEQSCILRYCSLGIELDVISNPSVKSGDLYQYADPHRNQAGNDLAAQTIAEYVKAH